MSAVASKLCRIALAACAIIASLGTLAAEGSVRGPQGLVALPFAAHNKGPAAMACTVTTAHWYTVDFGTARHGAHILKTLWADPTTGTVFILNVEGDRMPVETLWCGIAGRAWITRADIPLTRRTGQRPAPLRVECHSDATVLRCNPGP